jgi:hypothetical protein
MSRKKCQFVFGKMGMSDLNHSLFDRKRRISYAKVSARYRRLCSAMLSVNVGAVGTPSRYSLKNNSV